MMQSKIESLIVKETVVACCGQEAPYDHPVIYLQLSLKAKSIICPYCSKKFILAST